MRPLRRITVRPALPEALAPLADLARNLHSTWDPSAQDLFALADRAAWEAAGQNPVRFLNEAPTERLRALAQDPQFLERVKEEAERLQGVLTEPRWYQGLKDTPSAIAYFSPEFGVSEVLPQYSGGLGVLAGDHLKAASDLGLPLHGVGLFYRLGYFSQSLSADGMQQERYPVLDPDELPMELARDEQGEPIRVQIQFPGALLQAQVWKVAVGRVTLFLLDSEVPENAPAEKVVTDRLYGGNSEHRLRQEILLGVGGVRALDACGIRPEVFHTNEGHAGFLGLERIRRLIQEQGLDARSAVETVRAGTIFTTHTPVPAGIDRFPRELIERYFGGWAKECGVAIDDLMALGHREGDTPDERFNMAVMGLRLAGRSNAVSKLHGEVSRDMFADLWPDIPIEETPITTVTNGVHALTWVASEMSDLLSRYVLPEWAEADAGRWSRIDDARDDEIWRVKEQGREQLVAFIRRRLRETYLARGLTASDVEWCDEVLDGKALTVCFARRFATYKRATLLLEQPERLKALLLAGDRPVQFVFAGKAHPADESGKEM